MQAPMQCVLQIISSAAAWNICGLLLTLFGVIILYRFGMPFRVRVDPKGVNWQVATADPKVERENQRYQSLGRFGLILIMIGTCCQIVGAWLGR
jgi:hypothetical protein